MLSIGIGALQLMLDRGAEVEWFASGEIWIYAFLTLTGFWVFGVHLATAAEPFIDPRIFADRNFLTGLVFIFVIGVILLASLALLPPMLSTIYGYPTITTGLVMAPRGVGTMVSMLVVGRLVRHRRRADPGGRGAVADGVVAVHDDRLHAADGQLARSSIRASSRAWGWGWSSCRCRPSPLPRWRRISAPTRPACSAWCATSARPSASRR